jgi:ABC-type branched-subunit amino acid transport system ATPase component
VRSAASAARFRSPQLCADFSALDDVTLAVQARQGHSYRFLRAAASDASLRNPAMEVLTRVGLEARAQTRVDALRRRASPNSNWRPPWPCSRACWSSTSPWWAWARRRASA